MTGKFLFFTVYYINCGLKKKRKKFLQIQHIVAVSYQKPYHVEKLRGAPLLYLILRYFRV